MIRRLKEIVMAEHPGRRFVPASPSGINIWEGLDNFGKGVNWDDYLREHQGKGPANLTANTSIIDFDGNVIIT